jgi:hypothetical protein
LKKPTRKTQTATVSVTEQEPAAPKLVLGKLTRNEGGLEIDTSVRSGRKAARVVGGDLSVNSVTLERSVSNATTWPKLSCSGENQATLANASLNLDKEIVFADGGTTRSLKGAIRFLTGDAERMKIDANGPLEVAQAMKVRKQKGATYDAGIFFWPRESQAGFVGMPDDATIGFWSPKMGYGFTMNTETGDTSVKTTLTVGPLALPPTTGKTLDEMKAAGGRLAVTGKTAELAFVRQNLASWPPAGKVEPGDILPGTTGTAVPLACVPNPRAT